MDNKNDLDTFELANGTFGFSATKLEDLGATEYTLVTLVIDESGSGSSYRNDLEKSIEEVIKSCQFSPRKDNLLVRVLTFNTSLKEKHGFKLLEKCDLSDYKNFISPNGGTSLYDSVLNAVQATNEYARSLKNNDYTSNGIIIILTDGEDNSSSFNSNNIKQELSSVIKEESLESLVTILIGVGVNNNTGNILSQFKDDVGFTQYEEIKNANAKTLAKLAAFVSHSISAQSKSLGTGVISKPLSLLDLSF
jgi:uncharacterized protein YegL